MAAKDRSTSSRPAFERRPATAGRPALEIHRSTRRRRSGEARTRDGEVVLRLPAGMPLDEEQRMIERLVRKVSGRARSDALGGDQALLARAHRLADRYLDGIRASDVAWSGRMAHRHGSCQPATGTIRISREVARHPAFVVDYVLIHELAHLQVPDHSRGFHELVARFPDADRARGYLEGFDAGRLAAAIPPEMPADDEPAPSA